MTGPELRAWRRHWLLSQADLASLLSVHLNTVGSWERGLNVIPAFLPLALETLERQRAADFRERANGPVKPVALTAAGLRKDEMLALRFDEVQQP